MTGTFRESALLVAVGVASVAFASRAVEVPVRATSAKFSVTDAPRQQIEAALPDRAPAAAKRPRKLLIFCLNVGYGGHPSIAHANVALTLAGRKTDAFETVICDDPEVFRPESLRRFDAVFFNNTVGNLFTDPELRQSLADFVYGGGGSMGVHGTTVAFTR